MLRPMPSAPLEVLEAAHAEARPGAAQPVPANHRARRRCGRSGTASRRCRCTSPGHRTGRQDAPSADVEFGDGTRPPVATPSARIEGSGRGRPPRRCCRRDRGRTRRSSRRGTRATGVARAAPRRRRRRPRRRTPARGPVGRGERDVRLPEPLAGVERADPEVGLRRDAVADGHAEVHQPAARRAGRARRRRRRHWRERRRTGIPHGRASLQLGIPQEGPAFSARTEPGTPSVVSGGVNMATDDGFERFFRRSTPGCSVWRSPGVAITSCARLTQETFLRAYRSWPHVSTLEAPRAWLRRVTVNLLIDGHRRALRERSALDVLGVAPTAERSAIRPLRPGGTPSTASPIANGPSWPSTTSTTTRSPMSPRSSASPKAPSSRHCPRRARPWPGPSGSRRSDDGRATDRVAARAVAAVDEVAARMPTPTATWPRSTPMPGGWSSVVGATGTPGDGWPSPRRPSSWSSAPRSSCARVGDADPRLGRRRLRRRRDGADDAAVATPRPPPDDHACDLWSSPSAAAPDHGTDDDRGGPADDGGARGRGPAVTARPRRTCEGPPVPRGVRRRRGPRGLRPRHQGADVLGRRLAR